MTNDGAAIGHMVSEILEEMRPKLEAAFRAAFERGLRVSDARYAEKISRAAKLLSELGSESGIPDIPIGSVWTQPSAERAALGTVKPRVLELVSRDNGASIPEIEAIGIKSNSIRGTLYALQKEGKIQRRGDRWYAPSERIDALSLLERAS